MYIGALRNSALICCVVVLAACASTNAAKLGTATADRPPVTWQSVRLFRIASQVPGRYEEIALLNSVGDSSFSSEAGMMKSMQQKAGKLGANAVILDSISEPSAGAKVAAAIFLVSAQRKGRALAIYVFPKDEQSALPSMPAAEQAPPRPVQYAPSVAPAPMVQRVVKVQTTTAAFTGNQRSLGEWGGQRKLQCEYAGGGARFWATVYGACPAEMIAP